MSTTRRGFLKLLGIGSVAAPTLLKAALKKPTAIPNANPMLDYVTTGYCQVISCGSGAVYRPSDYYGEVTWKNIPDNGPDWVAIQKAYPVSLDKFPLRFPE